MITTLSHYNGQDSVFLTPSNNKGGKVLLFLSQNTWSKFFENLA